MLQLVSFTLVAEVFDLLKQTQMARLAQQTVAFMMETRMDWIHGGIQKPGGYYLPFSVIYAFYDENKKKLKQIKFNLQNKWLIRKFN